MADLSLADQLKFRRKAFTTQGTLIPESEEAKVIANSSAMTLNMSTPPPPPPLPLSVNGDQERIKPKQVFDLRPREMKVGPDKFNRPPREIIGDGININAGQPISAMDLTLMRSKLKSSLSHENPYKSDPVTGLLTEESRKREKSFRSQNKHVDDWKDEFRSKERKYELNADDQEGYSHEYEFLDDGRRKVIYDKKQSTSNANRPGNIKQKYAISDQSSEIDSEAFNKALKYIHKMEQSDKINESHIENWRLKVNPDPSGLKQLPIQSEELENLQTHTNSNMSESGVSRTSKVSKTQTLNTSRKSKNRQHRAPSVCFSFPEGNDEISEISNDDIINVNAEHPEYGSYEFVCKKLEIREPFVQPELNVLHAICEEYFEIANLTFAKRRFSLRSLPHNERVYDFLASRRKSGWLEKGDIARGVNCSRTLDFLFSVTLRRKSKKIEGHTLNLEGFKAGRILDIHRFTRIVKDAYIRRNYLFECSVGKLHEYNKIK